MIRATTPTILCKIKDVDLTAASSVYITIRQYGREITLTGDDLDVTSSEVDGHYVTEIFFHLTQSASLGLREGKTEIQANWTYTENGEQFRGATKVAAFKVDKQILERIVT